MDLASAVEMRKMWPTPTASDSRSSRRHGYMFKGHAGTTLLDAVCGEATPGEHGKLNPTWVGWLMGWPVGWLDPLDFDLPEEESSPSNSQQQLDL
jgi:DNA (cytosine-5)-methyltransferase 1